MAKFRADLMASAEEAPAGDDLGEAVAHLRGQMDAQASVLQEIVLQLKRLPDAATGVASDKK